MKSTLITEDLKCDRQHESKFVRVSETLMAVRFQLLLVCAAATEYNPVHLVDGSYNATALQNYVWLEGSCTRGAYVDYYVDVDESHANSNLFVEVVHTPSDQIDTRTDALSLWVYEREIPTSRWSELRAEATGDRSLSYAINANDLEQVRYYFSVRCSDLEDADFGIVSEFVDAQLTVDHGAHGHICRDELLYHYFDASLMYNASLWDEAPNHLVYRVCLPPDSEGQLQIVVRVGDPPLRVTQPIVSMDGSDECRTF